MPTEINGFENSHYVFPSLIFNFFFQPSLTKHVLKLAVVETRSFAVFFRARPIMIARGCLSNATYVYVRVLM